MVSRYHIFAASRSNGWIPPSSATLPLMWPELVHWLRQQCRFPRAYAYHQANIWHNLQHLV